MSFRHYTGQNQVKLDTLMKQDERNSKISNILLPLQHSRFEPLSIRNTIISFSTLQKGHNGISLAFDCNRIIYQLDNQRNISKMIEKGFGT